MTLREPAARASGRRAPVLITGGTAAARHLALVVARAGWPVVYALAGATPRPNLPRHPDITIHVGGFGGAEGLARWLRARGIGALLDATHPHARAMPERALLAARRAGVFHARFLPPAPELPRNAPITPLNSIARMAVLLPRDARAFAALGARGVAELASRGDVWLTARMLSPPAVPMPPRWRLVIGARGAPRATIAAEMALLRATRARFLLARHSTGSRAMLRAAARLGLPVLLLARPAPPAGARQLTRTAEALEWLRDVCFS